MAEAEAIGKVAEKGAEKGAVKVASKITPGLNIAAAAYDTTKAVKAGKYGTAAVAAAEAAPGPVGWAAMGAQALGAGKVADKAVNGVGKVAKGVAKGAEKVTSKEGMSKLAKVGAMTVPGASIIAAGSVVHAMAKHHEKSKEINGPANQMSKEPIDPKTGLPVSVAQARQVEQDNPDAKLTSKDKEKYQKQADAYNKQVDRQMASVKGVGLQMSSHVSAQDMKYRDMMEKSQQKGDVKTTQKDEATPGNLAYQGSKSQSKSNDSLSPEHLRSLPGQQMKNEPIDPKTGLPSSVARAQASEKDNPDAKLTAQDKPKFEQEAKLANESKNPQAKDVTAQDMKYREVAKTKELSQTDPTKKDSVQTLSNAKLDSKSNLPEGIVAARGVEANNPNAKLTPQDTQQYQQQADQLNNNQNYKGANVSAQDMKSFDTMKQDYQDIRMSRATAQAPSKDNGIANFAQQVDQKSAKQDAQNVSTVQEKTMTKDSKTQENVNQKSDDKDKSNGLGLGKLAVGGGLAAGGAAAVSKLASSFKGLQKGLNKNGKSLQQTMGKMTGDMQKGAKESQAKLQQDLQKAGAVSKGDAKQQASAQDGPTAG